MAGYFTRLQGYVYNGMEKAAEKLPNGVFAEITTGGVKKVDAAKDVTLRVAEKNTLFGMPALLLDVVNVGEDEVFFVENELPTLNGEEWNEALYELPAGDQVRMKRPLPGEQVTMTVADALYAALKLGDKVTPAAGGTVAAVV